MKKGNKRNRNEGEWKSFKEIVKAFVNVGEGERGIEIVRERERWREES